MGAGRREDCTEHSDIIGENSGRYFFSDVQLYRLIEIWSWNSTFVLKDIRIYLNCI